MYHTGPRESESPNDRAPDNRSTVRNPEDPHDIGSHPFFARRVGAVASFGSRQSGRRAGSHIDRHCRRRERWRPARRHRDRRARSNRQSLCGGDRRSGCLPRSGARRRLPAHRGAAGLYDDFAGRHPAARRTDGHARFSDGGFDDPGNGYGERRGAPAQRRQFEPWWQHQSRTGTGTACPGPQLDGAGDAGARKPHDERFSDNTGAPIAISANSASFSSRSTVSRYLPSAGSAGSRVQPGLDRRVPVHLEQI